MNRRLLLAIVAAVAFLGWGIERLIVTDREAIETLVEGAAKAVSKGDWGGFAAAIDDAYAERGQDKKDFVAWVRTTYDRYHPGDVGVEVADTTVEGDHAATRIVVKPSFPAGYRFGGRVELVRSPDGWRIAGVASDELKILGR